jgi:pimeloyl-ACP methyl ester carboxylesterase
MLIFVTSRCFSQRRPDLVGSQSHDYVLQLVPGHRPPVEVARSTQLREGAVGRLARRPVRPTAPGRAAAAGLVLVDPAAEERLFAMYQGKPVPIVSLTAEQYRSLAPQSAVSIPTRHPQTGAPFDRLPPDLYPRRVALDRRMIAGMPATVSAEVVAESGAGDYAMLSRLNAARTSTPTLLGDMLVVVLTRGLDASPDQQAAHAAIAKLSRNSRHTAVPGSYHEIHLSQPDPVITAILDVVSAVREPRPLR